MAIIREGGATVDPKRPAVKGGRGTRAVRFIPRVFAPQTYGMDAKFWDGDAHRAVEVLPKNYAEYIAGRITLGTLLLRSGVSRAILDGSGVKYLNLSYPQLGGSITNNEWANGHDFIQNLFPSSLSSQQPNHPQLTIDDDPAAQKFLAETAKHLTKKEIESHGKDITQNFISLINFIYADKTFHDKNGMDFRYSHNFNRLTRALKNINVNLQAGFITTLQAQMALSETWKIINNIHVNPSSVLNWTQAMNEIQGTLASLAQLPPVAAPVVAKAADPKPAQKKPAASVVRDPDVTLPAVRFDTSREQFRTPPVEKKPILKASTPRSFPKICGGVSVSTDTSAGAVWQCIVFDTNNTSPKGIANAEYYYNKLKQGGVNGNDMIWYGAREKSDRDANCIYFKSESADRVYGVLYGLSKNRENRSILPDCQNTILVENARAKKTSDGKDLIRFEFTKGSGQENIECAKGLYQDLESKGFHAIKGDRGFESCVYIAKTEYTQNKKNIDAILPPIAAREAFRA